MKYGNNEIILETKIDDKTLHFLPFLPTRQRKKIVLNKKWGEMELVVEAIENLNTYDLITLMFIIKFYLKKNWNGGYIGEGDEKREIAGLEIDLEKVCKERNILNKKINRKTILNSIKRLSYVDLTFKTDKNTIITKYIYEIRYDNEFKKIKIYANKSFIEYIHKNGILMNLSNFVKLENIKSSRKEYAILLYSFLNGTKTKTEFNKRKILKWREKYNEELLFDRLGFNETNMTLKEKRRKIRETFELLHNYLNLPLYKFNKIEKMWTRSDLVKNRLNKTN
jgi:hypothetical protein